MKNLLLIQQKLIPQAIELMERRYLILRQIHLSESIGRRTLSNVLGISERVVRSEIEFLKEQDLVEVQLSGVKITSEGLILLDSLKDIMKDVMGLSTLQEKVKDKLGIKKVLLVPGSFDKNEQLLSDVAKCAAQYFLEILKDKNIVSITGGSTMLEFSHSIKTDKKYKNVIVVPARGSFGKDVDTQSNTIVASVSKKLNAAYRLLNIPDELGEESMKTLSKEPQIKEVVDIIAQSDILIFGIGRADEMMLRRKLSTSQIEEIKAGGAVGEAFGYYFNKDGEVVYKLNTVGLNLDSFKKIKNSIMISAGVNKVEALMAVSKVNRDIVIVTDEESAYRILEL
jgi:central glycolytic genes regulator